MNLPDMPLLPWGVMDLVEEELSRNRHISFVLGEIAGALTICAQQPLDFPTGPSLKHFAAGLASARRKFQSLCRPVAAWHPFHLN